jgi:hypothetical protein
MCKVVNINNDNYDILIMRPSKWGNPYSHKEGTLAEFKVDNREESIKKYEEYLLQNEELMNDLVELKYKKIGCCCVPYFSCHGNVLKKYVDKLEKIDERNKLLDL